MNNMDKWHYIELISSVSNKYGDKLLEMMEIYGKNSLQEITYREAKDFWNKLKQNKVFSYKRETSM